MGSQDSGVGLVTKLWAGQSWVVFLAEPRDVSPLQNIETSFRIHPASYSVAAKDSFNRSKAAKGCS
jgi:hypothetical protein